MKKNTASQVVGAQMVSATDGSAFTGSVTVSVTGDAGTQAAGSVGAGACTHEGNGYHTYAPAQAETNYDLVAFTFTGTGAVPATVQIYTSFPQTGDSFARIGANGASLTAVGGLGTGAIAAASFAPGAIDAAAIANNAIDASAIADGAIDAATFAAGAIDAAAISADAGAKLADAFLNRDMSTGTDSGSATVRTVRQALRFLRNKWSISGTTLTVTKENDTDASWTAEVTATAGADPITASDPASV